MKTLASVCLAASFAVAADVALAQPDMSAGTLPFVPAKNFVANPKVYGKTYGEWSAKWWKWALSFPDGNNPVQDETGELCGLGQSGPVWFLAGSFGETGVERKCRIPAGKAIFYPIVNSVWIDVPGDEIFSDEEVRWVMAGSSGGDLACELRSTLDYFDTPNIGEVAAPVTALSAPMVRAQSPKFTVTFPEDNLIGLPGGTTSPRVVSEGYWVMLPPLKRGEHVLSLHGAACSPILDEETGEEIGLERTFETEVTYYLKVGPTKPRCPKKGRCPDKKWR